MTINIYIAGPITGIKDDNKPEFDKSETFLCGLGLEVVNPQKNGLPKNAPWVSHMKTDIPNMLKCDAIYALNGWHNSKGARAEIHLAEALGIPIFEQFEKDTLKLELFKKKTQEKTVFSGPDGFVPKGGGSAAWANAKIPINLSQPLPPKFPHQSPENAYGGKAEIIKIIFAKLGGE
jgi:nucleoside 2-deoxyribosyltransferase